MVWNKPDSGLHFLRCCKKSYHPQKCDIIYGEEKRKQNARGSTTAELYNFSSRISADIYPPKILVSNRQTLLNTTQAIESMNLKRYLTLVYCKTEQQKSWVTYFFMLCKLSLQRSDLHFSLVSQTHGCVHLHTIHSPRKENIMQLSDTHNPRYSGLSYDWLGCIMCNYTARDIQ